MSHKYEPASEPLHLPAEMARLRKVQWDKEEEEDEEELFAEDVARLEERSKYATRPSTVGISA